VISAWQEYVYSKRDGVTRNIADVFSTVPIPYARLGWRTTWCEEGQLVKLSTYFMSHHTVQLFENKGALGKALVGNQRTLGGFEISELHHLPSCLVADSSLFFPSFSIGCLFFATWPIWPDVCPLELLHRLQAQVLPLPCRHQEHLPSLLPLLPCASPAWPRPLLSLLSAR
jgi:hypothetical protein